ncbi:hypothetical protein VDGL01_11820 [Verticillium dahliae]
MVVSGIIGPLLVRASGVSGMRPRASLGTMTHCNGTNPGHFGEAAWVQQEAGKYAQYAQLRGVYCAHGAYISIPSLGGSPVVCPAAGLYYVGTVHLRTYLGTSDAEESHPRIQSIIRLSSQTGKASV